MLKFIGDAMLATISFDEGDEKAVCRPRLSRLLLRASANVKSRNLEREAARIPFADVDIALHVGEVLYGNVGAVDRLDFTVIGPAVNEVVRMEKLCERSAASSLFSLGSQRPRDAATDAWNRSDISSCAASMSPRKYLDSNSPRPPICNVRRPDENIVR